MRCWVPPDGTDKYHVCQQVMPHFKVNFNWKNKSLKTYLTSESISFKRDRKKKIIIYFCLVEWRLSQNLSLSCLFLREDILFNIFNIITFTDIFWFHKLFMFTIVMMSSNRGHHYGAELQKAGWGSPFDVDHSSHQIIWFT